ncbi:MAG: sigma-54-dependent Fis family transcriptional regulator [Spirochaetales bacterium]|nr:sigma-54-dependent Fis family transcriptional regulator [Spirochaetales bacterium]
MSINIFIIDDKVKVCKSLAINFDQMGFKTSWANDSLTAISSIGKNDFDLIILDLMLGDEDSRDLLRQIISLRKGIPVIMITGYGSIESAVDTIKIGAYDYIQKPVDFDVLLKVVESALAKGRREQDDEARCEEHGGFITKNSGLIKTLAKARKLAATDLPILILGENGTGKEVLADYIHEHSGRSSSCLQKINCAAFQESILDNELFGHNKGAYTGANSDYKGIFERADGSNLFLDEIGDMSLAIQAKILRTLQNKEVRRIGGDKTITVDVRFLAATNKNLEELISRKEFREDLFYRLSTAVIKLPPLNQRKEDIPILGEYFMSEYCKNSDKKELSSEVLDLFLDYPWPGNIRELKNTVQYACAVTAGDVILIEDLPMNMQHASEKEAPPENIREDMERKLILKTLLKNDYNKTKTAEELRMSRKTLYNKLERYGISVS